MELNNKFNIDDMVYTINQNNMELKCSICEDGMIFWKEKAYRCPECRGSGKVSSNHKMWEVITDEVKIKGIKVSIGKNNINIKYRLYCINMSVSSRPEKHLFKNIEEAQICCDEYNKPKEEEEIK